MAIVNPLSLASGISGLIKAAEKIASLLSGFTANMLDAPNLARNVVMEMQSLSGILLQLKPLLSPHHYSSKDEDERRSMVFVDQLVLTVAACIRSLAELEKELDGVVGVGMLDRLKWTVRETSIRRILEALQTHRSSLTLVLTILTAREKREAERTMEKLGILVERVAETNRELVDRIATSAGRVVPPPPSPQQQRRHTTTTTTATTTNTKRRSAISEINITPWVKFSFEAILQKTKAYRSSKRTSFLPSEDSTATPTPPTTSTPWSQLSSLNLAQVSNLAVVELPLWPEDIVGDSIRHYDFRAELPIILLPDDSAPPTPTAGAAPRKSPPPLSLRLLPTPPHTPRTPTNCDSPLPPLPTDDFTPPHSPSYTPSTHQAITKTLAVYTTLLELVPSPPPTWETGTNFRHHVSQFSTEMLRDFAVDVHDEVLWRRRGLGGGEKGGRLKGISDTQLEHLSADVVWEVRRRFAPMGLGGVQLEGNAF